MRLWILLAMVLSGCGTLSNATLSIFGSRTFLDSASHFNQTSDGTFFEPDDEEVTNSSSSSFSSDESDPYTIGIMLTFPLGVPHVEIVNYDEQITRILESARALREVPPTVVPPEDPGFGTTASLVALLGAAAAGGGGLFGVQRYRSRNGGAA